MSKISKKHTKKKRLLFKIPTFILLKDELTLPRYFINVDYIIGILVFLISFGIYLNTLLPTVGFHDSGELIAVSYLLGIAHPPGYPLYCLLGKLWMSIVPVGNIAYRMNIASALCASLACMMVYFITLKVVSEKGNNLTSRISFLIPAVVSALTLAFATTFWTQAVIAEKYTLNALFATLLIFILLKWQETVNEYKNTKFYLYLFAFTIGLSFTHHFQTLFLIPGSILLITILLIRCFRHDLKDMNIKIKYHNNLILKHLFKFWAYIKSFFMTLIPYIKTLVFMLLLFIIPLCIWFYLPLQASQDPPLNWGSPDTMDRFIRHITTKDFRGYISSSPAQILNRITLHITHFFTHQFTIFLVIIGLIGIFFLIKNKRLTCIFLLLTILTVILVSSRYNIYNIEDYYIPAFIIFSIFIGYGILILIKLISFRLPYPITYILFLIPIIPFLLHYHANDRSNYFFAYDYGRNLLRPIKENAIVFIKGLDHDAFPIWYLHYAEHLRSDLDLVSILFMYFDWYPDQLRHLKPFKPYNFTGKKDIMRVRFDNIFFNNKNRPIYTHFDENFNKDYYLVFAGGFFRVLNKNSTQNLILKELDKHNVRFLYRGINDDRIYKDDRAKMIVSNYISIYNNYGNAYNRLKKYTQAIREYQKALTINPNTPDTYFNIGIAYSNLGKYDKAIVKLKKAIAIAHNHVKAYKGLGSVYESKEELEEAAKWYKKAKELEPNNVENYRSLARVYYAMNKIDKVIIECKKMVELEPKNIESRNNLASLYFKKGEYKKAAIEFKAVLKLDPQNPYAHNMLGRIKNRL
jgi:tetratricopeptide (TPR) repeat protein